MRGDAFNEADVDELLQLDRPKLLYCDPPYGMGLDTDWSATGKPLPFKGKSYGNKYDPVIGDDRAFDPTALIDRFKGIEQFWWGADYYADLLPDRNKGSWIVWDKRLSESRDKIFGSCFELCWSAKKHKRDIARIAWAGFFGVEKEPERRRLHPTQKPILLAEWFIERFSRPGDIVVDLFGGAGATLLACHRLGRICRVMDINQGYCELMADRYDRMASQPALVA